MPSDNLGNHPTLFRRLIILWRSASFCLKNLPICQAVFLPVLIIENIDYINRGGLISLDFDYRKEKIFINGGGSFGVPDHNGIIFLSNNSKLSFKGTCQLSKGINIRIDNGGEIQIGRQVYMNKNAILRSNRILNIGDDCIFGWNVTLSTTDGHNIYFDGKELNNSANITIGDHTWVSQGVCISKGVTIAKNCIIAQTSLVTKSFNEERSLIGGVPAKILRHATDWSV